MASWHEYATRGTMPEWPYAIKYGDERLVETDVRNSIRLAEDVFANWRKIKGESIARYHLISMFGAKRD